MKKDNSFRVLIEGWRNYIQEGASEVGPGIEKIFGRIKNLERLYQEGFIDSKVVIKYVFESDGWGELGFLETSDPILIDDVGSVLKGEISFETTEEDWPDGFALGGFRILETLPTTKGYGPLLYEILIEKATEEGTFLMSDRHNVTDAAKNVWNVYLDRPDIEKIQLDINNYEAEEYETYQLTPDNILDDTSMSAAIIDKGIENWSSSSLSKGYYKKNRETPILDYLRDSDFIEFIEETT